MAAMRLLLDENVQQAIADFLRSRGHEIYLAREALAPRTSDSDLSKVGDLLGLIVVTWDRDLKRLAKRSLLGASAKNIAV
jgi:predicted nuclease of predicted toxin-antitoxin system